MERRKRGQKSWMHLKKWELEILHFNLSCWKDALLSLSANLPRYCGGFKHVRALLSFYENWCVFSILFCISTNCTHNLFILSSISTPTEPFVLQAVWEGKISEFLFRTFLLFFFPYVPRMFFFVFLDRSR